MIYLNDLRARIREEVLEQIKKERPDLLEAIEAGDDVKVGDSIKVKEYKIV